MKQRLIDANALHYHMGVNQNDKQIFYITGEDIDAAPTIDPESLRLRAHWDDAKGYDYHVCCSNCGVIFQSWAAFCNYCPNCGARMEDESDET